MQKHLLLMLCIALAYFPCLVSNEYLMQVTEEDGAYESMGAFFFLLTGLLFLFLAVRSRRNMLGQFPVNSKQYWYFFGFSLLFLFAFAEEISWGQRIFGFETPEILQDHNMQGEFNVHNLDVFYYKDIDGNEKRGLAALFTMHRLFYAAFFMYLVVLPLLNYRVAFVRKLLQRLHIPIPPLLLGLLFLFNLAFGNSIRDMSPSLEGHGIVEIKESIMALILLGLPLTWMPRKLRF